MPNPDISKYVNQIRDLQEEIQSLNSENNSLKEVFSQSEELIKIISEKNDKLNKAIVLLKSSSDSLRLNDEISYLRGIVENFSKMGQNVKIN